VDILRHLKIPRFCWGLACVCLGLAPFGDTARLWLRFERAPVGAGQWWRLLSAHVVHLSWPHTLMNVAGLLLIGAIAGQSVRPREWWIVTVAGACGISLGLYFLAPSVTWYVGLSGVLHALLMAVALALLAERDWLGLWLIAGVVAKILYEQLVGALPATQSLAGDSVIVQAHLYGAVCGVAFFGICRFAPAPRLPSL
jgi:rhomboid family GlyGly-CTERM serine protease